MALVVIFLILSVMAYKRSFYPLYVTIKEYNSKIEEKENISTKSNNLNELIDEVASLDRALGREGTSKETVQQGIINFASGGHPTVSINDLQPIHVFIDDNYQIITNQLDATGNINELLELSYSYEKDFIWARIVSMKFYKIKKNNNSEVLHLKMIFQNYENNKK